MLGDAPDRLRCDRVCGISEIGLSSIFIAIAATVGPLPEPELTEKLAFVTDVVQSPAPPKKDVDVCVALGV
jgi:hypothetical protein